MSAGFAHDAALAYLTDRHTSELVRFEAGFYAYDRGCYEPVSEEAVKLNVAKFLSRQVRSSKTPTSWREVSVTDSYVRDVLLCVRAETAAPPRLESGGWIQPAPFDYVGPLLPAAGTLIDLGRLDDPAGYLLPATPNLFAVSSLPVCPDPTASCGRWSQFLGETFAGDEVAPQLLQEIYGVCLLPDCRYEKLIILFGAGDTGKSTVAEILHAMLGQRNVSALPLEQFGSEFGLASLTDKLANIVFDASEIEQAGEGPLKAIVSGEPVYINRKHMPAVMRRLTAKLVFVANTLPAFRDTTSGLWRRVQLLHFSHVVPQGRRDPNLKATLQSELPGITHWAIEGLARLLRQGGFTRHEPGEALLEQYRRDSNPVAVFVVEECVLDADAKESRQAAYRRFKQWSSDNGFRPISSTEFNRKIAQLLTQPSNPPRDGRGGDRMFVGFRLRGVGDMVSQFRDLAITTPSRN